MALRLGLITTVAALTIACAGGIYFLQSEGIRAFSVHNDHLSPSLRSGDLILVERASNLSSPVSFKEVENKIIIKVPAGGYIYDFVRRPTALVLLVYLPALLITLTHIKRVEGS